MKRSLSLLMLFLAIGLFAACGDKPAVDGDAGHGAGAHDHDTDHDGDHDEHGDHEHEGDEDDAHGERHEIGKGMAGPHGIALAVFGEIEADHEAVLDVVVSGAHEAVRAWVGIESGRGSMKSRLDGVEGDYHGHIEVPATLPADSAIWIEVQDADGARHATAFALPK